MRKPKQVMSIAVRLPHGLTLAVRAMAASAGVSISQIVRDAMSEAWRRETGSALPHFAPSTRGQMQGAPNTTAFTSVSMPLAWIAAIRDHAGCVARWVVMAVEASESILAVSRTFFGGPRRTVKTLPPIDSRWPAGRELRRGEITGRLYVAQPSGIHP